MQSTESQPKSPDETLETIARLHEEIQALRQRVMQLEDWPDDENRDWRGRCLVAEGKLAEAYERMRRLDDEIMELKWPTASTES